MHNSTTGKFNTATADKNEQTNPEKKNRLNNLQFKNRTKPNPVTRFSKKISTARNIQTKTNTRPKKPRQQQQPEERYPTRNENARRTTFGRRAAHTKTQNGKASSFLSSHISPSKRNDAIRRRWRKRAAEKAEAIRSFPFVAEKLDFPRVALRTWGIVNVGDWSGFSAGGKIWLWFVKGFFCFVCFVAVGFDGKVSERWRLFMLWIDTKINGIECFGCWSFQLL